MFDKVKFDSAIAGLANDKLSPTDAATLVRTKAINPALKIAVKNFNTWKSLCESKRDEAKNILAQAEQKTKEMLKPEWIPNIYTVGEVKGAIDIIKAIGEHLKKQALTYAEAFAADGMRGNAYVGLIAKSFPQMTDTDVKAFETYVQSVRSKIIADNRGLNAIRDRIEEYAKRCETLAQAAEARHKKALGMSTDTKKELDKSADACDKHHANAKECLRKFENKIKAITDVLKKKDDKNAANMVKGLVGERNENLKKALGANKTLRLELDQAEKTFNGSPTKDVLKEFATRLVKLKKAQADLEKEVNGHKTKTVVLQDKVIKSLGIKI